MWEADVTELKEAVMRLEARVGARQRGCTRIATCTSCVHACGRQMLRTRQLLKRAVGQPRRPLNFDRCHVVVLVADPCFVGCSVRSCHG